MSSFSKTLELADKNNGEIQVIQEVLIFRCKNNLNDYFLGVSGTNYDENGYPIDTTNIEIIDISDIVASYSLSFENQFSTSQCQIEIANIDSLFSPENITFLDNFVSGTVSRAQMKSFPVDPTTFHDGISSLSRMVLSSGKDYYAYNPNYYKNDSSIFSPLFKSNHIIKIREGLVVTKDADGNSIDVNASDIEWDHQFLGLISTVSPGLNGGSPTLNIISHDFIKLLNNSYCDRTYICPIRDYNGNFYYDQFRFSKDYGKPPSFKVKDFENGFNKNYKLPTYANELTSKGDRRTWLYVPPVSGSYQPYWAAKPEPEIYITHVDNSLFLNNSGSDRNGFLVRVYNGLEIKGEPVEVIYLPHINFTGDENFAPSTKVADPNNWCCSIECDITYDNNQDLVLFSVQAEGGLQVIWNGQDLGSKDGVRVRTNGYYSFSIDNNGTPVPQRNELNNGDSAQTGFTQWTGIANTLKQDHLKIIYKCGQSYGSFVDFNATEAAVGSFPAITEFTPGWRNILSFNLATSNKYSDVPSTFNSITSQEVASYNNNANSSSFSGDDGLWRESVTLIDFPTFIKLKNQGYVYGDLVGTSDAPRVIPKTYWKLAPDDEQWGYNILYTRGWIQTNISVSLNEGDSDSINKFTFAAKYGFKDITNSHITITRIIEDLVIEDIFGIPRYDTAITNAVAAGGSDANDFFGAYEKNQNTKFNDFVKNKFDITEPGAFVDSIKLDADTTRNCFDAFQKILQNLGSNFKIRANAEGKFTGEAIMQSGAPAINISEWVVNSYDAIDDDKNRTLAGSIIDPIPSVPKGTNITDREFISLSYIGFNGDQENDKLVDLPERTLKSSQSGFRRESFIVGEYCVDKPGLKIKEDLTYEAPAYSGRRLIFAKPANMKYDNTLNYFVNETNGSGSENQFIDKLAIYRRRWITVIDPMTSIPFSAWTYDRYELAVNSPYIQAVIRNYDANNNEIYSNVVNMQDYNDEYDLIQYFYIDLSDIFSSLFLTDSLSATSTGTTVLLRSETSRTDWDAPNSITPKTNFDKTQAAIDHRDTTSQTGFTIKGSPLIIDYQYKLQIVSSLDFPVDDSELYTMIRAKGKRSFVGQSDVMEDLLNTYYPDAADLVIPEIGENIKFSAAEVLKGLAGLTGNITIDKGGFTQFYSDATINPIALKRFLASFQDYPKQVNVPFSTELMMPGILIGYGKSLSASSFLGFDTTREIQRFGITEAKRSIDIFGPGTPKNFDFTSFSDGSGNEEIAGNSAGRFFSFRWKQHKINYAYEFNFSRSDINQMVDDSAWVKVDHSPWVNVTPTNPSGSQVFQHYVAVHATGQYVNFQIYYGNSGGPGAIKITYKERFYVDNNTLSPGGDWSNIDPAILPLTELYAGIDPAYLADDTTYAGDSLAAVKMYDIDSNLHVYDFVAYTYGKHQTFVTNYDTKNVSKGVEEYVGTTTGIPMHPVQISASYGLTPITDNGWLVPTIGEYVADSLPELDFSNADFPVCLINSGSTMTSYPSGTDSDDGIDGFVVDMQTSREIGEIGLLVGFPPAQLTAENPTEEAVATVTYHSGDEFNHILSRRISGDGDGYLSTVYQSGLYIDNDYTIYTLNDPTTNPDYATAQGVLAKSYYKTAPVPVSLNDELRYEIFVEGKKDGDTLDDASSWKTLVDWQKVYTRAEFFRFNFTDQDNTNYRYLKIKFRRLQSNLYQSYPREIDADALNSSKAVHCGSTSKGIVTGPDTIIDIVTGDEPNIKKVREIYQSIPGKQYIRFINITKLYIIEKDDITVNVLANKNRDSQWFNPLLEGDDNKIIDDASEIINHNANTVTNNSDGTKADCLNTGLRVLNDGIRPKETSSVNLAYNPRLELNQTVWVTLGVMGGYAGHLDSNNTQYYLHPGKLMLIDKISKTKNGTTANTQITLRNYNR